MICDLLRLDRRVIVITGAAGAIGSAVAVGVAEAGATVVAIDQNPDALGALVDQLRTIVDRNLRSQVVMSLARSLALEFGPLGIRVNTVAPGAVETRPPKDPDEIARWEKAALPLGRRVKPEEIAAVALFLLSDLSSSITGQTLVVDGGGLAKPAFLDADNVPVFVTDKALRDRMRSGATHLTRRI